MPCTYYECITLFTEHLPWLKGEVRSWAVYLRVARLAPARQAARS